jgi:hypothetical protein
MAPYWQTSCKPTFIQHIQPLTKVYFLKGLELFYALFPVKDATLSTAAT